MRRVTHNFGILTLLLVLALPGGSCHQQPMNQNSNQRTPPNATSTPHATAGERRVATGLWGGDHVRLEVTDAGARIEFDCAHGTLDAPLVLQDGRFDVPGTFVRERGGPIRDDDVQKGQPVRFIGQVEGARMTISFTFAGTNEAQDSFTLIRGEDARLFKCK